MDKLSATLDETTILEKFDRSSPDALLRSIAGELLRLHRTQAVLAARLTSMETLQAAVDRIAAAESERNAVCYPNRVTIDAADAYQGALGFYAVEHDQKGVPYRWSGPDRQFSFQFFIDRSVAARFVLRFGKLFADVSAEALACFVDGEEASLTVVRGPRGFEATGIMPTRKNRGGSVLTFICPEMGSPESQGSTDQRQLGLSFLALTVENDPPAEVVVNTPAQSASLLLPAEAPVIPSPAAALSESASSAPPPDKAAVASVDDEQSDISLPPLAEIANPEPAVAQEEGL